MDYDRLILQISCGDMSALEELYSQMYSDVFALIMSTVRNAHTSADLTQDVFLLVYTNAKQFKPTGKGRAWILRIAGNTALNYLKRTKRIAPAEIPEASAVNENPYAQSEDSMLVEALLRGLSDTERQIMILKARGYSHKEIANIISMPEGTVRWKYSKLCKKLESTHNYI